MFFWFPGERRFRNRLEGAAKTVMPRDWPGADPVVDGDDLGGGETCECKLHQWIGGERAKVFRSGLIEIQFLGREFEQESVLDTDQTE